MANDVTFKIVKTIAALGEKNEKGYRKEVNFVSWNDADPKIDVRQWNEDHTKMSKGITLTKEEGKILAISINAFLD